MAFPSRASTDPDEKRLDTWCSSQRKNYKNGILSQERISLLESIPGWSWDFSADQFDAALEEVKQFVRDNNRVPSHGLKDPQDPQEKKLAIWCTNRRKNKDILTQERITELESIPGWYWDFFVDQFENSLEEVKQFVRDNNKFPSSRAGDLHEKKMGSWCHARRGDYKLNKLSKKRIKVLESIPGWYWDNFIDDLFNTGVETLRQFVNKNSKMPVIKSKDPDEDNLASWCSTRRKDHKKSRLTSEQIENLESVPGWSWDIYEDQFNLCVEELQEFVKKNNRFPNKRSKNQKEAKLGLWYLNRRCGRKQNILSKERIAALESIPGWQWFGNPGPRQ